MQKFYASSDTMTWPNGAIGHRPGGAFDCLGPFAIVRNCPIAGTNLRRTCYATGYADTFFSVPACTRVRGQYIAGYFTTDENGCEFRPMNRHKERLANAVAGMPTNVRVYLRMGADYLDDAKPYPSRTAAIAAYRETAKELWRYGQRIEASLHYAHSRGELAEYPDLVLSYDGKVRRQTT